MRTSMDKLGRWFWAPNTYIIVNSFIKIANFCWMYILFQRITISSNLIVIFLSNVCINPRLWGRHFCSFFKIQDVIICFIVHKLYLLLPKSGKTVWDLCGLWWYYSRTLYWVFIFHHVLLLMMEWNINEYVLGCLMKWVVAFPQSFKTSMIGWFVKGQTRVNPTSSCSIWYNNSNYALHLSIEKRIL